MQVFCHHIYEYQKGIRDLILHTMPSSYEELAINKLKKNKIDYVIYYLSNGNMNIFFGAKECIDIIRSIDKKDLNDYTPEEDFMLGILLGYNKRRQCERYFEYKAKKEKYSKVV